MSGNVIDNPPYEPPPGGADVCPPVVLEDPPDPEIVELMEETALPPDPREPTPSNPPTNIDVPAVVGVAAVGETLSCTMGNWTGEPTTYFYQWMTDVQVGTDSNSYVIADTDAGKDISCTVTAVNAAGSAQVMSNAVSVPPGATREA
jgi:hypothetical protein